ncbi:hypothetical protein TSOC_009478 [Tetrabaena socialis]|uniref:Uncharacterized protein n=1 Tax=Tetrabaena socialis TaxID=47790 RepID=A0A2J7ZVS3_9CHLO|nr:hypothetical protein TSOC_009478 [Tetrabaena socialis]|eukprot:PNH04364.1 hypothetical protein TSOC_009478 [Tetrabaena socialis]
MLGKLLLVAPAKGEDPRVNEKAAREVLSLKAYVLRAMRYLFSVERNRKASAGGGAGKEGGRGALRTDGVCVGFRACA